MSLKHVYFILFGFVGVFYFILFFLDVWVIQTATYGYKLF